MRITDNANIRLMTESISGLRDREGTYYRQMSSGKRVEKPSDAPVDAHRIALFRQDVDQLNRYQGSVETVRPWLQQYDSVLNQVNNLMSSAFQLGSQADNTTMLAEREVIVTRLETIQENLVSLGNSKIGPDFIFSGTDTTTQPFTQDPVTGNVSYNGNSQFSTVDLSFDNPYQKNLPGDRVFMGASGGADVYGAIGALIASVSTGTGIEAALMQVSTATDRLAPIRVENGARLGDLQSISFGIQDRITELTKSISELEDVDMVELISGLNLTETSLQALFSSVSKIGKNSLFNYIA